MWKHKNFINLQLYAGETWVLNSTLSCRYLFYYFSTSSGTATPFYQANFTSNGQNFVGLSPTDETGMYDATSTWNKGEWQSGEAYRTLIFSTPPTGNLLTWLQANGTKQSTPQPTLTFKHFYDAGTIGSGTVKFRHYSQQGGATLINFTINGTAYQAEEGMTWEQWCNSSYNTSNGRYFISSGYLKYTSGYVRGPSSTSTSTNPHGTDYPQANGVYTEVSGSGGSAE